MKDKELILKKGYTIKVVSWEDDGDNYKTQEVNTQSIEDLKYFIDICDFCSETDNGTSIANEYSYSPNDKQREAIINLLNKHNITIDKDYEDLDVFFAQAQALLGYSEYYLTRVCDSYTVVHSDVDIYAKKVDVSQL